MRTNLLLLALSLFAGSTALAQKRPAPPSTQRLDELAAKVAEVEKALAEVPAVQDAVGDVASQVTALRQEIETLKTRADTAPEVREKLDALDRRVTELGEQVAGLRAGLFAATGPESRAMGGTGLLGYDGGFRMTSSDGRFSARLTGFFQLRHETGLAGGEVRENTFQIRRARVGFDGWAFTESLAYKVVVFLERGTVGLHDYYITAKLPEGVSVVAGQFKVPYSRSWLTSAAALSFVERSLAEDEFRYDRDVGVSVGWKGLEGRLEARLGFFNGAGKNVPQNDNIDPLVTFRLDGNVLGKPGRYAEGDVKGSDEPTLSLGAAVAFENTPVIGEYGYTSGAPQPVSTIDDDDVDDDGDVDNIAALSATADLDFRWRGAAVQGGVHLRKEDWGTIGQGQAMPFAPREEFLGAYAQAEYFVVPGMIELGARWSWAELSPLRLGGRQRTSMPFNDERTELSLLAQYHRYENGIELGLMYSSFAYKDADPVHRVLLELQLEF